MAKIWPSYGPYMTQTWSLYGPNKITLNSLLLCMTLKNKFEPFHASRSKDIIEIAKAWPLYGSNNFTLNGILLFGPKMVF